MLKKWNRLSVNIALFCVLILCSLTITGQQSDLQDRQIFDIIRSGDGEVLALNYGTDVVDLIDARTGSLLYAANLSHNPRRLSLSPTGDRFMWTDGGGSIYLYDLNTSSNVSLNSEGESVGTVGPMAWNPVNNSIAIASGGGITVYDLNNNLLSTPIEGVTRMTGGVGRIVMLSWSPDGELIASSQYSQNTLDPTVENRAIQIWDIEVGTIQSTPMISYDDRGGGAVAWNPQGTQLALLTSNELTVYDVVTDSFVEELSFPEENRITVVWSPTGDYLATGGTEIRIWDTDTWEVVATLPAETNVRAIQWSPDGEQIYSNRGESGLSIDRNPAQREEE